MRLTRSVLERFSVMIGTRLCLVVWSFFATWTMVFDFRSGRGAGYWCAGIKNLPGHFDMPFVRHDDRAFYVRALR